MDVNELRLIGGNLDRFIKQFDDCIKSQPSRRHLLTYVRCQLSDLERKRVEPIALEAGVAPRTLPEFLELHRWDQEAVRRRVQDLVLRDPADEQAIAVVDETGCPKKGTRTAGVQRQHGGARGKTDNCVVSVQLGYTGQEFHTPIDSDLYLPEKTWHEDRQRCREAGIPDDVVYRPKRLKNPPGGARTRSDRSWKHNLTRACQHRRRGGAWKRWPTRSSTLSASGNARLAHTEKTLARTPRPRHLYLGASKVLRCFLAL